MKNNFKNPSTNEADKKILLMGLGILGGGVNIAQWLLKNCAELTITDLKNKSQLKTSLNLLPKNNQVKLILGKHEEKDFIDNDVIVLNQDIRLDNPFLKIAKENKKQIEDELSLFTKNTKTKNIIAITGTRGKTTTTNWVAHLLKIKYKNTSALGNSPEKSLIKSLNKIKKDDPVVIEIPSCLTEKIDYKFAPKITIITNLFADHLNRYSNSIKNYALAKAKIFSGQTKNDYLLLNYDNVWTKFFLKLKPNAKIYFFSIKKLPANLNGIYFNGENIIFRENKKEQVIFNAQKFVLTKGKHNLSNLLPAIFCALKFKISVKDISKQIKSLPQIKFRQERIYKDKNLEIYNDTAATSPEGGISAIERFKNNNLILITGGTDANLDFKNWAKVIKQNLVKKNIIFLNGSATQKMLKELGWRIKPQEELEKCFKSALQKIKPDVKNIIILSPSAKSFEKFKNEFDRGEKFNKIVKKYL